MKRVYITPESETIRLGFSSAIADDSPFFSTSQTVNPENMDAKAGNFQFEYDAESGFGGWETVKDNAWE